MDTIGKFDDLDSSSSSCSIASTSDQDGAEPDTENANGDSYGAVMERFSADGSEEMNGSSELCQFTKGPVVNNRSKSISDSEKELEILLQAEQLQFGETPPRHSRRIKQKARSLRKNHSNTSMEHSIEGQAYRVSFKEKRKFIADQLIIAQERGFQRREKQGAMNVGFDIGSYEESDLDLRIHRKAPVIKLDSPNRYKSITPVASDKSLKNLSNRRVSCDIVNDTQLSGPELQACPQSRLHFFKTFSLLINMGDKGSHCDTKRLNSNESSSPWQIDYDEILWLELQAWHAGKSVEEEDCFLETEREQIDKILNDIIHFYFPTKMKEINTEFNTQIHKPTIIVDPAPEHVDKARVPAVPELKEHDDSVVGTLEPEETETWKTTSDNKVSCCKSHVGQASRLDSHSHDHRQSSIHKGTNSTSTEHFTGSIQQLAMRTIIMLLMKVEKVENLYPTTKALAQEHPKYLDEKFVRNFETLNLWLNTCKELYHKLHLVASLVQVDPEDNQTWEDWFDHGLGLKCVKTHQTYAARKLSSSSQGNEHPVVSEDPSENVASRPQLSSKRSSIICATSTSRYRPFVEKCIRQVGFIKLIKRIKEILHGSLWKARQGLEVPRDAHEKMERQHAYGKVFELVEFFQKISFENPTGTSDALKELQMVINTGDFQKIDSTVAERGVWSKGFTDMGLPSFLELYLFLVRIAFDVIHECLRYRLDHKPKGEPSSMSIRQLIHECKEVMCGAVIGKQYLQDMTLSVLTADDKERIDALDKDIDEFEEDVQSLLQLYFSYLQSLFHMLQRLPQASRSLKNTMEEEWVFAKEICPHIKGGESQAGLRFCVLASGLLDSTAHFLGSSIDDCSSSMFDSMDGSSEKLKDIALEACRNYKKLFNETRQRAAKALGFAKMLQKDLGIAAEYKVITGLKEIFHLLKETRHVKIDCKCPGGYEIYAPDTFAGNRRHILQLLNVTCGFEDPADACVSSNEGYIILLNTSSISVDDSEEAPVWQGQSVSVTPTVDTTIALASIQVTGLMVIACNSYQLVTQRNCLQHKLGVAVRVVNEQTSSHQTIAEALSELKDAAQHLADAVILSVEQTFDTLDLESLYEMEEAERILIHQSYVETMHVSFNLGFEYLRELTRLLTGQSRIDLGPRLIRYARMWMKFVTAKIEKGRGTRPRWATHGLDFLLVAYDPRNLIHMSEEEFQELKRDIHSCLTHIIGTAGSGSSSPVYRSGSPLPNMNRSRSHPGGSRSSSLTRNERSVSDPEKTLKGFQRRPMSDPATPTYGGATELLVTGSDSEGLVSPNGSSPGSRKSSIGSPTSPTLGIFVQGSPIEKIRASLKHLEDKRNAYLTQKHVIGKVSGRKADLAYEMVHVNFRRVNFKWQLGYKIGEGQFGKVYSCVNLDSGELMAMKQVRFNPNDYSAIQEMSDEIKNIEGLQHESLVKYYGVELHRDEMLIFMEYCADGTIADVAKLGLPESMIRMYTMQIVKAINFLHQNGIVHRDVKGSNIFVSSNGIIKLGDFGSAVRLKDPLHTMQGEVANVRGTAAFMAPEVITLGKGHGYGRAADIWSLGCVVVEMASGKAPWSECDNIWSIMFRVGDGASPTIPDCLSEEGLDFLAKCFVHDPGKRWTAEMLEDHTFIKVLFQAHCSTIPEMHEGYFSLKDSQNKQVIDRIVEIKQFCVKYSSKV